MGSKVTYVFGDMLTGRVICEIPLFGASMTRAFGAGDFRGSFQLDQTGKLNADLVAATVPGRCFVVCERNAVPIWGGTVWSRTYQSQAKVASLYCRATDHYPERRLIRTDFTRTAIEQRNIFLDLWQDMMLDPNSIKVDLPADFDNVVLKSCTFKASEFKSYRSAMDELANAADGFDWSIDWNRTGGVYTRALRVGYPTLGQPNPDVAVVFDYPGAITNYWENATMGPSGTHIYGIGSGEGTAMLTVEAIHDDLLAANFPRFDQDVSLKGVNDINILTALTTQQAQMRRAPGTTITAECKGDKAPEFGSYGLGDRVKIVFDDPMHPDLASATFDSRVIGWEYYPPSDDSVEMSRLVFEGDDL